MVAPGGAVHVHDVAPAVAAILYVFISPGQTLTAPPTVVMPDGFAGNGNVATDKVRGVPAPQLLDALTDMVPPVVPAIVVIELPVDDPLHPEGKVQL